ncbi:rod shape determining protein RodA [Ereboglobus sp. PH5-10]|uniref:FtsW/RodA/SpoVE family cell cycle protein n=1 Tax=Ereboglobus sp. PH5-10 TaxID=2940629 RepID=UPI002406C502|nr:FtsW/RodA/SpoVE family cell cycle protein [Ereboglobus sp. PH5-10]MDF9827377.1 rod shape determining protein RodA [Ereboglobus sp. PH5-10]
MVAKTRISLLDWFSAFKIKTQERFDVFTPAALLVLGVTGVMFIYSAQLERHGTAWKAQCIFWVLGIAVYVVVSLIDYRIWLSYVHWIYIAALVPLVLVLVPGIGDSQFGAQRWINFGFFKFQPSETAKIAVLLMSAGILARSKIGNVLDSLGVLGKLALAAGVPIFLIFLQPDIKSAIVLPPVIFAMLYVSRLSLRFFAVVLGAFVLLVGVVAWDTACYVNFMQENGYSYQNSEQRDLYNKRSPLPFRGYQRNRILAFAAPNIIDQAGTGDSYNLNQSLISIGTGGLTGKGWRQGTQAKLGYLPTAVSHNDFIVSVIAEETGFLGSLTVISLFGLILFNSIRIAGLARDRFGTLIAIGVTMFFTVHVFVNIAMSIGLVPITGIPLPFISYGGSFLLCCCLLQGLVQSVYRFRRDFS